jgi:hypothetical protein
MPLSRFLPRVAAVPMLTFALMFAPVARAAPKPKQAEELTYTAPAGWERAEQERIVVFTPPKVPPSRCALIVTPGENLDGDFLKWFKTKWEALSKGGKVVQGGDRTGQEGPNGSSVLYQAALVEAPAEGPAGEVKPNKRTGLLLYAVNIGSAVHWVLFRTDGPELFNQHKKTVNQFLAGMKFVESGKAPPDRAKAKAPAKQKAAPHPHED